ncbi:hypothetical protein N7470_008611 [Penicillium chermesinum]|nr:hypothetical protein N7470_008611 [Penicillium chermesinum]
MQELRTTPAKLDSAHASQHLQFTPSTRIMVLDNALAEEGVSPQAGGPLPSSQGEKANAGGYTMPDLSHLVFRPEFAVTRNIVSRGLNPFSGIVWKHAVARQVLSRADAVWAIEGRPITQDEFDAFTAADTTKLYWTDLGKPVGFGVTTAWLYYRRRAKLPPGITMTDHFRALWGLPRPDLMRQLFTTGFKLFFGVTASTIGFGMLGSYFFLNHMLTDPRLRDIAYQETDNRAARQEGIDTRKKILSAADRRYPFRHNNLRDRIIESLSSGSPVSLSKDDGGSTAGEVAPQGFNDYAQYQDISYGSDSEQQSSDNAWQPPATTRHLSKRPSRARDLISLVTMMLALRPRSSEVQVSPTLAPRLVVPGLAFVSKTNLRGLHPSR